MIAVSDLGFTYPGGAFHLTIPALQVAQGERLAIVGPSGTGKTTLLNLLSGIVEVESGVVDIAGSRVDRMSATERRAFRIRQIGFVFQNFELVEYLTVRDNILYPYRLSDVLRLDREVRSRAEALAGAVGLADKLGRYPQALSQGEKQRVAICRALITQPRLLLADEATGNLDPANKGAILDLLFAQAKAHDATLIAVTHDHELLPRFDRVVDFLDFRAAADA